MTLTFLPDRGVQVQHHSGKVFQVAKRQRSVVTDAICLIDKAGDRYPLDECQPYVPIQPESKVRLKACPSRVYEVLKTFNHTHEGVHGWEESWIKLHDSLGNEVYWLSSMVEEVEK